MEDISQYKLVAKYADGTVVAAAHSRNGMNAFFDSPSGQYLAIDEIKQENGQTIYVVSDED